ncbi:MAG: tRNA(Met) cytidine acetyltransferase TmcA [Acidilobaceae archaeon]
MNEDVIEVAERVAKDLKSAVPTKLVRFFKKKVAEALKRSVKERFRVAMFLSSSDPVKAGASLAKILLSYEIIYRKAGGSREKLRLLYIHHDEFEDARLKREIVKRVLRYKSRRIEPVFAVYEETEKFLGTTFQILVLDLTNDLKPNDIGRLIGVVEGGGLILATIPPWDLWDKHMTIFKKNLLVPGFNEPRHIFISWFKRKLLEYEENIFVYDLDGLKPISGKVFEHDKEQFKSEEIEIPYETLFPRTLYSFALTKDQVEVIKALEWLYEKPPRDKKKVIVVTADRGRGKSCAVGIGLVGLAKLLAEVKPKARLVVTAPDPFNVQSLMELALKAIEALGTKVTVIKKGEHIVELRGQSYTIEYWEPYVVPKLKADVVAVDEASGIHVPLLHKIWRSHKRLVFTATIHGYEGAGRGFNVRFLSEIKNDSNTLLKILHMEEPIRYARGDPIEKWLFDALLLNAEPAEIDEKDIEEVTKGDLEYVKLDPEFLFSKEGEKTLRELFGIYTLAHYRNEPDDLGLLADAPHHFIRAIRTAGSKKVVAAIQVAEEGGLSDEIIERLLRGEKTPGNIIPDRLLKHHRLREFGQMRYWRIVRIAVHPSLQGKGIGSFALKSLEEEARERGLDYLGSGFGVNEKLLRFWLKNRFTVVHLSPDRNPVSGEYTALVLKPLKPKAETALRVSAGEFFRKILFSLYDTYRDLEVEVAQLLLEQGSKGLEDGRKPRLSKVQIDRLWVYCFGPMTYEAINDVILELVRAYWSEPKSSRPELSETEEALLIAKVLQGRTWEEMEQLFEKKMGRLTAMLKLAITKLAKHYYGLTEESQTGLTLNEIGDEIS